MNAFFSYLASWLECKCNGDVTPIGLSAFFETIFKAEAWQHKYVYVGVPSLTVFLLSTLVLIVHLILDIFFYAKHGWFVDKMPPHGGRVYTGGEYQGEPQTGILRVPAVLIMVVIFTGLCHMGFCLVTCELGKLNLGQM